MIDTQGSGGDQGPISAQPAEAANPALAQVSGDELRRRYESELDVVEHHLQELLRRAEEAERERDSLRETVRRLETAFAQHLGELRALGTAYLDRAEQARRGWQDTLDPGTSTVRHQADDQSSDR